MGIAKYLGIAGGGGAAFAAISFGIGYLAIKSHDAMLGLPTTTTTNESYVRMGALFFSNSLYFLISTISEYLWTIVLPAIVIVLVIALILSKYPLRFMSRNFALGLIVAYAIVNLMGFWSAKRLVAVLHPDNKGLLLKLPEDVKIKGYEKDIHELLRKEGGVAELQKAYSLHLIETIALICMAVVLFEWRRSKGNIGSENYSSSGKQNSGRIFIFVCDWLFRPILYVLIIFHFVLLPTNYGILCISNEYPKVLLTLKEGDSPKEAGFLLSDMSVDLKEVVFLLKKGKGQLYSHQFLERNNIEKIEVVSRPGKRNILAKDSP